MISDENMSQAKQLTRGLDRYDGIWGLSLLADGRIIYECTPNGKGQIWSMDADGDNAKQIVDESGLTAASPDGRFIVFQSDDGHGVGLFRLNLSSGERSV
jgi:Tol biopolymer transport system component